MSTWWTATVSGIPFSALTSRHSRIASSMFFRASLSVVPWLTHPGIAGHSATKTPSSSRSTVTTNFIRWILLRSTRLHFRGRDSLERPADLLDRDPGLHERLHQKVDRNGLVGRFHLRDARRADPGRGGVDRPIEPAARREYGSGRQERFDRPSGEGAREGRGLGPGDRQVARENHALESEVESSAVESIV